MTQRHPDGLRASVVVLAAVVMIALLGLALAGNWPKVPRVAGATLTYVVLLLVLANRRPLRPEPFMLSGAVAGLASGLLRPEFQPGVVAAGMLGASMLLAPLHWWAVRTWRRHPAMASSGGAGS